MTTDIENSEWYKLLIEDCGAIMTEAVFTSRFALVEGYHQLGIRIIEDGKKEPVTKLLQRCAVSLNISERTIWYAVQFATKYPSLDELPGGKNVSWHKICNQHLGGSKDKTKKERMVVCPGCGLNFPLVKKENT